MFLGEIIFTPNELTTVLLCTFGVGYLLGFLHRGIGKSKKRKKKKT